MFGFFGMMNNYEDRAVARYEKDGLIIDTCSVTDGNQEFETAVASRLYNDGEWVIVEAYDTKEEAQEGHDEWVNKMINNLPAKLIDCGNSMVSQMAEAFGCDMEFESID